MLHFSATVLTSVFSFDYGVILAPEIFFRTQDSAPKVNLNFHKCKKGLLCSHCLVPSLTKSMIIGALKINLLRNWHYSKKVMRNFANFFNLRANKI